ncbi:unnamed protein product [Arabidopsis halleri]
MEHLLMRRSMNIGAGVAGSALAYTLGKHLRLPPVKLHCSMLAEDTIKSAVRDYKEKQAKANANS